MRQLLDALVLLGYLSVTTIGLSCHSCCIYLIGTLSPKIAFRSKHRLSYVRMSGIVIFLYTNYDSEATAVLHSIMDAHTQRKTKVTTYCL